MVLNRAKKGRPGGVERTRECVVAFTSKEVRPGGLSVTEHILPHVASCSNYSPVT